MMKKLAVLVVCLLGTIPLHGCLGQAHKYPGNRTLKLGNGLEPTVETVLPGYVIFSYQKTITDRYEVIGGKMVWLDWDDHEAYLTVLEGMRRWKNAHPKAVILGVSILSTSGTEPTAFFVQYKEQ